MSDTAATDTATTTRGRRRVRVQKRPTQMREYTVSATENIVFAGDAILTWLGRNTRDMLASADDFDNQRAMERVLSVFEAEGVTPADIGAAARRAMASFSERTINATVVNQALKGGGDWIVVALLLATGLADFIEYDHCRNVCSATTDKKYARDCSAVVGHLRKALGDVTMDQYRAFDRFLRKVTGGECTFLPARGAN